jgi:hypothetical protein
LTLVEMGGGVTNVGDCTVGQHWRRLPSTLWRCTLVGSLGGGLMTSGGRSAGFISPLGSVVFYPILISRYVNCIGL